MSKSGKSAAIGSSSGERDGSRPEAVRARGTRGPTPMRGSVFRGIVNDLVTALSGEGDGSGQAAGWATGIQKLPPRRGAVMRGIISDFAAPFSSSG